MKNGEISVKDIKLVGSTYKNGYKFESYAIAYLSNNTTLYIGHKDSNGFKDSIAFLEKLGYNVEYIKTRVEEWVKTGK